ncbi:hypothetical protein ABEY65_28170 [Priestia aryabhattai]|uniref:hypothetical protein n=1 Tax=Priestia aryabhattai TaxID=412384 RepID=UPI003D2D6825
MTMTGLTVSNKLQVTKEVKDALDSVVHNAGWSDAEIIEMTIKQEWSSKRRTPMNGLSTEEILKAIKDGYQVKAPKFSTGSRPSDAQVMDLVETYQAKRKEDTFSYGDGIADGIRFALRKMNLNVEGITE